MCSKAIKEDDGIKRDFDLNIARAAFSCTTLAKAGHTTSPTSMGSKVLPSIRRGPVRRSSNILNNNTSKSVHPQVVGWAGLGALSTVGSVCELKSPF